MYDCRAHGLCIPSGSKWVSDTLMIFECVVMGANLCLHVCVRVEKRIGFMNITVIDGQVQENWLPLCELGSVP